jgi:hypothetical protein
MNVISQMECHYASDLPWSSNKSCLFLLALHFLIYWLKEAMSLPSAIFEQKMLPLELTVASRLASN